jgi:hypothetical protein
MKPHQYLDVFLIRPLSLTQIVAYVEKLHFNTCNLNPVWPYKTSKSIGFSLGHAPTGELKTFAKQHKWLKGAKL